MNFPRRQLLAISLLGVLLVSPLPSFAGPDTLTPEFQKKIVEAIAAYNAEKIDESEKLIAEAEAIQPGTIAAMNLLGAVKLKKGDSAGAKALFEQALKKDPEFYPAKFNLAEIPYQEKKYGEAREAFQALVAENPKDELAQFKILLTYLLERNMTEARRILDGLQWPGDTPSYYFSHAAWEYAHRNVAEAEGWIASASRIFPPHINALYATTLEELGWLKMKSGAMMPSDDKSVPAKK